LKPGLRPMVPAPETSSSYPANVSAALRALLGGLIDYAGLFPPAKLSLADAARNFVGYVRGPHAWMLGKFVVPAAQLGELRGFLAGSMEAQELTCPLAVLLGSEPLRDAELIRKALAEVATEPRPLFSIDAVEFRPGSPAMVAGLSAALPQALPVFCEVPFAEDITPWLAAIREGRWFAKIRTGGVTPESFPSSATVAEFLVQCKAQGVAFKATAGLHHPVRSEHPLTYEPNSVCGMMHGFLNVFLGAALLEYGITKDQLIQILDDTQAASFRFSGEFAHWNKLFVSRTDLTGTRQHFAISFGSCSFEEPIQDLQKLGLL
jgi:hypothetical protein